MKELAKLGARLMKQTDRKSKSKAAEMLEAQKQQETQPDAEETHVEVEGEEEETPEDRYKKVSEMAMLALKARQTQSEFDAIPTTLSEGFEHNPQRELSLRKFFAEFKKVVDISDVLLEVLDARDPMGCRLKNVEKTVESQWGDRKTVILLLNKVDLVPPEVVDAWVEYFHREQMIVIPFMASSEGTTHGHKRTRSVRRNTCVSSLYRTLRTIGRGETQGVASGTGARKSITVGVVGYPNVGKSSIINALRRKSVVGVGNTPGFTTGNTEVDLRKDIKILDCPGVVMPGEDTGDVVLRNAVKVDQLENPMAAVTRLFERCDNGLLSAVYSIDVETQGGVPNVDQFIRKVGIRRGRIRQGGVINELETAKMILQDWNDGRIGYFTLPPESDSLISNAQVASTSALATGEEGDDKVVLSSFSRTLTADGLPTFHLTPTSSIGGKKRERLQQDGGAAPRRRHDGGSYGRRDDDDDDYYEEEEDDEDDWEEDDEDLEV